MRKRLLQEDKRARIRFRTRGRPREIIRKLALAMLVTMALAAPGIVSAMEVEVPYEQDFTNDSAEASVADTFDYKLTAESPAPAPDEAVGGVYEFSLSGDTKGVLKLNIPFTKPGYYYYTVKSNQSPKTGYTYDPNTYRVMIMIVNGETGLAPGAITIQDADSDKYDSLLFKPSYYKKRPNPDPDSDPTIDSDPDNPGGGGNPGGDGNPDGGNPAGAAAPPADGNPAPAPPETNIDDPEPPLAGVEKGNDYWALVNLICMILTILTALLALIFYIRRRKQNSDAEDRNDEALKEAAANGTAAELEEIEDPDKLKRKGIMRIVSVVVAIISVILFFLTEDMTLPMELVDEWTIWMIILLVIALILTLISRKNTEETEDEQTEQA